ncbi:hypothetical protein DEALK_18390 [Dehalogenimonas alkenigignens]|uniref:Uncharacterized protein n=1 Tax=Dehalogenimonas alkenigignens TaxID=1217799 RepID=A0A0W0GK99_9CHLR|nr:hypothetical protein [Dehalogenimonas alkenigignens]KTB48992.1 hypothetical protein DEALK_18390 [Dehalogenimonas alkenigignens]
MPGEFYVEDSKTKVSLKAIEAAIASLEGRVEAVRSQTDKLAGEVPYVGFAVADWQVAESNLIVVGAPGAKYKLHDLSLGIQNLAGTQVTVRLYKKINGVERRVYEQSFDAAADGPGLPVVNGSWAIHDTLRITVRSNDPADNGKAVDYDFLLEAM